MVKILHWFFIAREIIYKIPNCLFAGIAIDTVFCISIRYSVALANLRRLLEISSHSARLAPLPLWPLSISFCLAARSVSISFRRQSIVCFNFLLHYHCSIFSTLGFSKKCFLISIRDFLTSSIPYFNYTYRLTRRFKRRTLHSVSSDSLHFPAWFDATSPYSPAPQQWFRPFHYADDDLR